MKRLNAICEGLNGSNSINPSGLIIRENIAPRYGTLTKYWAEEYRATVNNAKVKEELINNNAFDIFFE